MTIAMVATFDMAGPHRKRPSSRQPLQSIAAAALIFRLENTKDAKAR
jgi:hypothetical protein